MGSVDSDLTPVGVRDIPLEWLWDSTSIGTSTTTTYESPRVHGFAATERVFPAFERRGFQIGHNSHVLLSRHEASGIQPRYSATLYLFLERGPLALKIGVDLGDSSNVDELVSSHGTKLRRGYFLSTQSRISGGRGQRKAVIDRARELYELGADVREYATSVEVYYATRGGKFGRMDKTAQSSFKFDEFDFSPIAPASTRSQSRSLSRL